MLKQNGPDCNSNLPCRPLPEKLVTLDDAFAQAIREDLSDDTPWLIYADWLEEAGDPRTTYYRHRRLTNALGMPLVAIPAGKFVMGSPPDEERHQASEGPQHPVEITRPFYLGVYQVTQDDYERLMGVNPSHFAAAGSSKEAVRGLDTRRFPVEGVSWHEAVEFCRRLSALPDERQAGRHYRLPTEAEWEYACRAGAPDGFAFHFGPSLSADDANFDSNYPYGGAAREPDRYLARTAAAGSYRPNAFGLCDMHGNVREWCRDWFDGDYYMHSPAKDPPGPALGRERVLRGGSWFSYGWSCRAANRCCDPPTDRSIYTGFRVAADVTGA
jgi:uncharacterized protein (TIGR02996 family)